MVAGFKLRNPFEAKIAEKIHKAGVKFGYESVKFEYQRPVQYYLSDLDYIPFSVEKRRSRNMGIYDYIYIEVKGWPFESGDRTKYRLVKLYHPKLDLRFVFYDAFKRLGKSPKSKTLGEWAESIGCKWAHKTIPDEWLQEIDYKDRMPDE